MIRQCFLADTGILFYRKSLERIGLDPGRLWPKVLDRPPPLTPLNPSLETNQETEEQCRNKPTREEEEDLHDALSKIHDELRAFNPWQILEYTPLRRRFLNEQTGKWKQKFM